MEKSNNVGAFPSGQRGQTVNLLRSASVVRIHQLPPSMLDKKDIMPANGLTKPLAGIISCPNSEMHFRRYFLRENGLEPPCIKFSYGILCTLHNQPANAENGTRRLFYFRRKIQKRFSVGLNPYRVEKITIYLYSMHKSPVAALVLPNASRRLFLFP